MRAVRTRRWLILALILGLTAECAKGMPELGADELFGQGSKDYQDYQTIEDCQQKTIPVIEEFMHRLLADGGGQHYAAGSANKLILYETKTGGREYTNAVYEI